MTCKSCKFYKFEQNDMLGACKRYPTVVNKAPTDWCGEEIPCEFVRIVETPIPEIVYDINTDEVKKRGRKKNVKSSL